MKNKNVKLFFTLQYNNNDKIEYYININCYELVAGRLPALARVESTSTCVPSKDVEQRGRPINPAPVRHGFIPDTWFQMFYNKTGYTGE